MRNPEDEYGSVHSLERPEFKKPKLDGHKPSVLSELLNRPFAQRVRLKKDIPFFIEPNRPYVEKIDIWHVWVLRVGEEGKYNEHFDNYYFQGRDGYVPYFPRQILARLPEFVEAI